MGFMVAVDTLLCFRLSVRFTESMWARNIIQNLVLNYVAVMLLRRSIVGKSERTQRIMPLQPIVACIFFFKISTRIFRCLSRLVQTVVLLT